MKTTTQQRQDIRTAVERLQRAPAGSDEETAARLQVFRHVSPATLIDLLDDADASDALSRDLDDLAPCTYCSKTIDEHIIGGSCISYCAPKRRSV